MYVITFPQVFHSVGPVQLHEVMQGDANFLRTSRKSQKTDVPATFNPGYLLT